MAATQWTFSSTWSLRWLSKESWMFCIALKAKGNTETYEGVVHCCAVRVTFALIHNQNLGWASLKIWSRSSLPDLLAYWELQSHIDLKHNNNLVKQLRDAHTFHGRQMIINRAYSQKLTSLRSFPTLGEYEEGTSTASAYSHIWRQICCGEDYWRLRSNCKINAAAEMQPRWLKEYLQWRVNSISLQYETSRFQ